MVAPDDRDETELRRTVSGRAAAILIVVAAVAVMVATVAGVAAVRHKGELDRLQKNLTDGSVEQSALRASQNPANRHVTLTSADKQYYVDVVVSDEGLGFVLRSNLPSPSDGYDYQLWADSDGHKISLGVMGGKVGATAFNVPKGSTALSITKEQSGGSVSPSEPPVVFSAIA